MTMQTLTNLLTVITLYVLAFGTAELLYKKGVSVNITRKIVHIVGGVVTALLPLFIKWELAIVLGLASSLLLIVFERKKLLNSIHKIEGHSIGALLFTPSLTLTAAIFWPINVLIFQGVALILGLSDGMAGIIGKQYGKKTYKITGPKTIEGSVVFFLTTSFLIFGILYFAGMLTLSKILVALAGAFLITTVEAVFSDGWDNLFIPIVSGTVLYFIL
jgi:dolichol kinase